MARFKFGKKKKTDPDTSITSDSISSPVLSPEKVSTNMPGQQLSPILINGENQNNQLISKPSPSPWKRHKLFDSPFPRYRHAAAAITSDKKEIFVMGGLKEGSVFGDTLKIFPNDNNGDSFSAKTVEIVNNNNPPARVGHSSVLCGNAYIIYGGDTVDTDFNGYPDNNFYLFNVNNNKYTVPSHILNKPNGRYGHTIGVISLNSNSSRLYLFGGQLETEVFNDLYYFELNTFKSPKARWELIEPSNNLKPPPVANHSMSVFKNKIYVFGGIYNNDTVSNDLWCFDALVNKWTQLSTTGAAPPPVNEHSSCIVNDKLFVYGGNDFHGSIYDSLHVLDLHTLVWSKLGSDFDFHGPGPRCGHSMTFAPAFNKIFIMGGDKNDYIYEEATNFDTYEEYDGREVGTMLYALDLNSLDQFLESTEVPERRKVAASARPDEETTRAGFQRHARSFSAGPEDFRTPTGSPERGHGYEDIAAVAASGAAAGGMIGGVAGASVPVSPPVPRKELERTESTKFVDVDVPSSTISETDADDLDEIRNKNFLPEPEASATDDSYVPPAAAVDDDKTPEVEPQAPQKRGLIGALNGVNNSNKLQEDSKVKKIISELNRELNELKASTKVQMQNATERIALLEKENYSLRENTGVVAGLNAQLDAKERMIQELKSSIDPKELEINDEASEQSGTRGITELTKYKLDRLELNNKLLYLEQENARLNDKFVKFEPFMDNQIGQLSNFQKIIKVQEEKIHKLSQQVVDEQVLHQEIFDWKSKYEKLSLEFENYKTINADDEVSEDEEVVDESGAMPSNRSILSTATRRSKRDISSHLENLVSLWSSSKGVEGAPVTKEIDINQNPVVLKLQSQVTELLRTSKQQQQGSSQEIGVLQSELDQKLHALRTFEENYRDALQSVNNTSKALHLTQDELNNQKILIEKLIKENNELKLFKKASRRISSRATPPIISEEKGSAPDSPVIPEEEEDEDAITSAHYSMKVKDLEADLYIMKQERDQLKESVTGLQKQLYLAQNSE